eukprot:253379-Chlamydomonas_euryale.AAC.1
MRLRAARLERHALPHLNALQRGPRRLGAQPPARPHCARVARFPRRHHGPCAAVCHVDMASVRVHGVGVLQLAARSVGAACGGRACVPYPVPGGEMWG